MAKSAYPTSNATHPTRSFCIKAVSFGVQMAMIGVPVYAQLAIAKELPMIKRTRPTTSQTDTLPTTLSSEQSYSYTNGTDNLATLTNSSVSTKSDEEPILAVSLEEFDTTNTPTPTTKLSEENDTYNVIDTHALTAPVVNLDNVKKLNTTNNPPSPNHHNPTLSRQLPNANNAQTTLSPTSLNRLYQRQANACQGVWHYPTTDTTLPQDGRLSASADYGYYNNQNYGELSGNVQVVQGKQAIFANKVTLNTQTGQASATGQVLFHTDDETTSPTLGSSPANKTTASGIIGIAQRLDYNLHTKQALASDVAFAHNGLHAHGHAGGLDATNANQTILTDTSFSTCPPDRQHWELSAHQITLNKETGRGIAKNTTLKIRDKTIVKLPYFNFPIDDRRASGFLLPHIGINSQDGFELSTPYYLNLAPNYDATITPTLFSNKNPRVAGEFRYLSKDYGQGSLQGAILPSDRQYDKKTRGHLFFDHQWRANKTDQPHWTDKLSLSATYRHISDNRYLSDFDNLGIENNALNLPRRLQANYQNAFVNATLKAETFQKLEGFDENGNLLLDKDRPYAKLPQLSVNYHLPPSMLANYAPSWLNNRLLVTGWHDLAYFKKSIKDNSESEKSGFRAYNSLEASYPLYKSYGFVTPKLALSHLYMAYDEDSLGNQHLSKKEGSYSAFVPRLSIDSGLFFYKKGAPMGWLGKEDGGHQLLSPRLKYLYSPYKDQSAMPNFETSTASLSYDQLLSDSWFLGYDRLADLHTLTPALNYRYIDKNGQTRVEMGIAEQFFLSDVKVGLNGTPANAGATKGKSTGLSWQMSLSPYQGVWLDGAGSFKRNYHPNALMLSARYQPNATTLFNVGMVNRKDDLTVGQSALSAYTGGAIFKVNDHWQLIAQAQYDSKKHKMMDTLLGVNYEDCCVGISIYGREYRNDLRPSESPNRAIMAELRLSGLTGQGQLNRLLSDKILGFDAIKSTWRHTKSQ